MYEDPAPKPMNVFTHHVQKTSPPASLPEPEAVNTESISSSQSFHVLSGQELNNNPQVIWRCLYFFYNQLIPHNKETILCDTNINLMYCWRPLFIFNSRNKLNKGIIINDTGIANSGIKEDINQPDKQGWKARGVAGQELDSIATVWGRRVTNIPPSWTPTSPATVTPPPSSSPFCSP